MQTLFALLYLTSNAAVLSMAVSGSIVPSALLADPVILPPSSYVSLSAPGSHYTAPLTQYGKFEIGNVDVDSPLRVDVQQALVVVHTTIRGNEWDHIGPVEPFPILLQAVSRADYFTVASGRVQFDVAGWESHVTDGRVYELDDLRDTQND
ncbi:hypothetical protein NEOLI_002850 [Neolecta irregularis DAH-3]|uniref:Uncharacterized protein n=1 Tax=Neolecta irregularis (strain DAH-3) TaxID=1198029 RepID=A0A1U7LQJ3_NEOID|nr:hypothetical protein NEOLI_002850 [Neolecta irregularis DAH-3]|eukprot:OLL24853.1 hypothetical protein NEOLI_002850 [Neolecta irregularis DAH-3]